MSKAAGLTVLVAWMALDCAAVVAQPPPTTQEPEAQIAVRVELVNVDVTVTDGRGNYVRGLTRERFRVLDEGQPQPITHFTSLEAPAQVLLLVETGPAVYMIHREHLLAAHRLLDGLAADDAVALATYDSDARLAAAFTTDKRALQQQVSGLRYNLGNSRLNFFGSLAAALDWLAATPGKKSVVVLTTGLDDGPPARWEALVEQLRASEAAIFPVALGGELRDPPKLRKGVAVDPEAARVAESFAAASRRLEEIATLTGGRAFFPREAKEFDSIYRQIATILRHTYRLGFAPPARDGTLHRLFVQLLDEQGRLLGPFDHELAPEPQAREGSKKSGFSPRRVRYRLYFRRGYVAPQGLDSPPPGVSLFRRLAAGPLFPGDRANDQLALAARRQWRPSAIDSGGDERLHFRTVQGLGGWQADEAIRAARAKQQLVRIGKLRAAVGKGEADSVCSGGQGDDAVCGPLGGTVADYEEIVVVVDHLMGWPQPFAQYFARRANQGLVPGFKLAGEACDPSFCFRRRVRL